MLFEFCCNTGNIQNKSSSLLLFDYLGQKTSNVLPYSKTATGNVASSNSILFPSFRFKLDCPEYLQHVNATGNRDVGGIDIGFCLKMERSPLKSGVIYDIMTVMLFVCILELNFDVKNKQPTYKQI